jgi:hypothetical protein
MAIDNDSVFEYRATTGGNTNGGFYVSDAGTTDYSQQDAAQATFTNLSTDVAGTQVTDDDGGNLMTAQFVGNGFNIGGVLFEVQTFIDANNVTIDRSAGSSQSGLSGKIGGALALPTDAIEEIYEPGNIAYYKSDGTYTLTGSINTAKDGVANNPIRNISYNSSRGDNPTGTDRALIAGGAYDYAHDNYWHFSNFRHTGTAAILHNTDEAAMIINCDFNNSSGTANRVGCRIDGTSTFQSATLLDCSATSANGDGFNLGISSKAYGCVASDCGVNGFEQVSNPDNYYVKCIADSCDVGFSIIGRTGTQITNCTIYNCTTYGINVSTTENMIVWDNIISDCGTGIFDNSGFSDKVNSIDWNHYHNNGTDLNGLTAGDNDSSGDPEFADAPNGNFSPGSAVDTVRLYPLGFTTDYYQKGAVGSLGSDEVTYGSV